MEELSMYVAKSAGILLLFLGVYYLVLRRETFFQENRFFLVFGMLISILLPFLVITRYIEVPLINSTSANTFIYATSDVATETASIPWTMLIWYGYIAGIVVFLGKFLIELFSLFRLLFTSTITKRDGQFIYIETDASFSPFSFFNYIVYNPTLYSTRELEAIIKHEQAHSRQLHSVDVFVSKLYCIFFWFNPFAWIHKKFMLQNLEFLADRAAIQQTPSKKEYQLTLLKVSGNTYCPALTNNFYNSLIKKRIVMLQKTQSTQVSKWKQLLIVPMLIAFVFLFNTQVIAKEVATATTNNTTTSFVEEAEEMVVVITKNTSVDELKAYKKLFRSQKITFEYSDVDFNSKGEISSISLVLKTKDNAANGKFETVDDKAISDIQVGKRGDELFIKSSAFPMTEVVKGAYTYTIDTDYDEDGDGKGTKKKKIVYRTGDEGTVKVNTWVQKEGAKTIEIKKEKRQRSHCHRWKSIGSRRNY
jgi:beta-lactamase regulating signal transducer with metallopeptidase domain